MDAAMLIRALHTPPEFIRDANYKCCSDRPGWGRSAQTSYLDYGAPHQRRIAASTFEGNSSENV